MVLKKAKPIQINANYRKTEALLESGQIDNIAETDLSNVNVGSENYGKSLMVDSDGDIEFGNPSFTPGESGVVVPDTPATGANAVNKNYVDSLNIGTSADESSFSGSLWARIKYALANMVGLSGNQTIADTKTFSASPIVPTTPDTTTSAVNQAYVESTVDGVNNILHKSGNEVGSGKKALWTPYYSGSEIPSSSTTPANSYMDFGKVFNSESHGTIAISVVGRANYFFGVIEGSNTEDPGVIESSVHGEYSQTGKLGLYFVKLSDGIHLMARRKTSAGEGITIQIFGISNVTTAPDIVPKLTYPNFVLDTEIVKEIVVI